MNKWSGQWLWHAVINKGREFRKCLISPPVITSVLDITEFFCLSHDFSNAFVFNTFCDYASDDKDNNSSLISPLKGQFQCAGVSLSQLVSLVLFLLIKSWCKIFENLNDPQRLAGITNKTEWGLDCWTPGVGFISRRQAVSQFPTTWDSMPPHWKRISPFKEYKHWRDSIKCPRHPRNRKTKFSQRGFNLHFSC